MGGLQEQLTAMEPVLIKTQAEVEVMIVTIMSDKEEAGKTQREASTHSNLARIGQIMDPRSMIPIF